MHVLPAGEADALAWGIIAVVNPCADLRHVLANELRLLDPAVRRSRGAMLRLLHEDFREVGASGRIWDRDTLISALAEEIEGTVVTADRVQPIRLGPDAVLVTYRAWRGDRTMLCSSVWRRDQYGWRLLFHQGTVVDSDDLVSAGTLGS